MENASKALIIAGAILIAILLISVAILIINSTGDVTDQVESQGNSMAIQAFNAQFLPYEGTGKSALEVRNLKNAVNASNLSNSITIKLADSINTYTATDLLRLKQATSNDDLKSLYASLANRILQIIVGNVEKNSSGYTVELYYVDGYVRAILVY